MSLIILGIDPGTIKMGYGVICINGTQIQCKDYGMISVSSKQNFQKRVQFIYEALGELYQTYHPHHTAVEKVFFGKNVQTAFKLGHIFALCLLQSQKNDSLFFEYASRFVKKSITFSGRSSKQLVQHFIANFFSLSVQDKSFDATDALAVAFCHSREWRKNLVQKQLWSRSS